MFTTIIDLANLTDRQGFIISGAIAGDRIGLSVSGIGDINGDGFDDIIIGKQANQRNNTISDEIYVIFGKVNNFQTIDLAKGLVGTQGFIIQGIGYNGGFLSINGAGDINKDGFADIIIGNWQASTDDRKSIGKSYVIFGQAAEFSAINLNNLSNTQGFLIKGASDYYCTGFSVNSAGDMNADGYNDVIITGAFWGGVGIGSRNNYVIFGKASGFTDVDLAAGLYSSQGIVMKHAAEYDYGGISGSFAGDVNNDGHADIIMGLSATNSEGRVLAGESYIVFGKANGFPVIDLTTLTSDQGSKIKGAVAGDWSGSIVNGIGDFNGDGYDDIVIAASQTPDNHARAGKVYVLFGQANSFEGIDLASGLTQARGFEIKWAEASDYSGGAYTGNLVSGAGDVNGDGYADIIIGVHVASPNGRTNAGKAYVIFGKAAGFNTIDLTNGLASTQGFIIQGAESGDYSGYSVSRAGDINNDGFDDILIGAFGVSPNSRNEAGASYVIFGGPTVITGTPANDVFTAWARPEKFLGNGGIDTVSYIDSTTGVTINLAIRTGATGYAEKDIYVGITNVIGSAYDDNLIGNDSDNIIEGRGGADYIDGGMGNNTASYANSPTAVKVNLNTGINTGGDAEGDVLLNIINLIGSDFNDVLSGNAFNNYLKGGIGDDVLISIGGGSDILEGQEGNDRFVISRAPGHITILDFTSTKDKLDLRDFNELKNFNDIIIASISEGTDTTISLPGAVKVTLKDITDLKYSTVNDDYILNGDDSSPPKWIDTTVGKVTASILGSVGSIAAAYIVSQLGCAWKHHGDKIIINNHNFQWFCGGYKWLAGIKNPAAYNPLEVAPGAGAAILLTPEAKAEIKVINVESSINHYQFSDYQLDSYSNATIEINLFCNNSDIDV